LVTVLTGPATAVPLLLFASSARRVSLSTLGLTQYLAPIMQLLVGVVVQLGGQTALGLAKPLEAAGDTTLIDRTGAVDHGRPEVHGDVRLLRRSLDALAVTERALRAGDLRPVDFESVWADVWSDLPARPVRPGTPRAARRRGPVD
ncbi:hypothetical protein IAE22_28070, partial [Bacillus sp. S34]|nr:hypothetical protein [Bacillus sp. S34]